MTADARTATDAAGVRRIAMWSGPRNLSTALMYGFANRPDCACWDEPFYAFYLDKTGADHPLREEIVAAGETSYDQVVARCLGPVPQHKPVFYLKLMTHHMLAGFDRAWIGGLTSAFLIRTPERVLASYARKRDRVVLEDIGFIEQCEIFDRVAERLGAAPPVVDADDLLADPRGVLTRLCSALGIPFFSEMLSWPPGPHDCDGVWARHWYGAAWRSTSFTGQAQRPPPPLPDDLRRLADTARPYYERMRRLAPAATG